MALRSNASTTSLMNDARSPSGNHSRMSGGNNNRWSCEYGRKRWLMSHTLLARAPLTQHFQSDRPLAADELSRQVPAVDRSQRQERKLLLVQDSRGKRVHFLELDPVDGGQHLV